MKKIPDFSFSHIGFYVTDINKMVKFYTNFMGFTVTDKGKLGDATIVFMSRDPREHHQMALITGRPKDLHYNVINQISFRLSSLADLKHFYQNMKKLPSGMITEIDPITHGNALSIYFRDPEGNRLELFIDAPWYCHQPLRVPFNPEDSDEEIWSWLEQLVKTKAGFKTREEWMLEIEKQMEQDRNNQEMVHDWNNN